MILKNHIARLVMLSAVMLPVLCATPGAVQASDTEKAKEHYNMGVTAMQEGNTDEAIMAYRAAIAADPDYVDAYINLGAIHFEQGDYDEAQ
ncbi:MAG: tetratricopeptide repeat protein, partial [Candidatus Zixiibacteriota bacterium]